MRGIPKQLTALTVLILVLSGCGGPNLSDWRNQTERAHATLSRILDELRLPAGLELTRGHVGGSVHPVDPENPYASRRYLIKGDHQRIRLRVIRALEAQGLTRSGSAERKAWEDEVYCSFSMRGGGRSISGFLAPPTCHPPRWKKDIYLDLHLEVSKALYTSVL